MLFGERGKAVPGKAAVVKGWVRELLAVPDEATVMVAELACHEDGCPPIETVIAALAGNQPARQWKLHKTVAEVTREDIAGLPPLANEPSLREWRCPD